jgi:multiple sugar transport system permease protein
MTGGGPVDATTVLPIYTYKVFFQLLQLGAGSAATMLLMAIPLVVSILYIRQLNREAIA